MLHPRLVIGLSLALLCAPTASVRAADHPVGGAQLTLKRNLVNGKGSLSLVLRDPAIPVPAPGATDDPTLAGLELTVFGQTSTTRGTFGVPAAGGTQAWSVRVRPGVVTYVYKNPKAARLGQDVQQLQLRTGAGLKIRAPKSGLALDPAESGVAVRVQYGSTRVCAVFGGDAVRTTKPGAFVARDAAEIGLADCDDASLERAACGVSGPACNGACQPGWECAADFDGSCACRLTMGCPGGCPQGWICAYPTTGGTCVPPFCGAGSPGMCDGACEAGTSCATLAGLCFCLTPCDGGDAFPACGGSCAEAGLTCTAASDGCFCLP